MCFHILSHNMLNSFKLPVRFLKFWQESNQDTRQTIYSNEFQRANRHVFALSYMYFYMFIIMCIQYYYSHKGLNFIVSMLKSTKKVRCVQHGISKINMYVLSIAPVLFGYGLVCRDLDGKLQRAL